MSAKLGLTLSCLSNQCLPTARTQSCLLACLHLLTPSDTVQVKAEEARWLNHEAERKVAEEERARARATAVERRRQEAEEAKAAEAREQPYDH